MVAEMYEHDNAVFYKEPAWHGNGIVVDEAWTPRHAAEKIMGFSVDQVPLMYMLDGKRVICESHVMNIRSDTKEEFGIVSANYQPIQNVQVADFCEALRDEGDVRVESAGTIRNGKRIWFLLQGERFEVALGDTMAPYILVSNGHDGSSTFRVTPTTVRVVCSNTLHMVIPRMDDGSLRQSAISIRHTLNVMERVADAKTALAAYGTARDATRQLANDLASKDVNSQDVQAFFLESYTEDYGEIPSNPQNKKEERRRERSLSAYTSFTRRFDDEKGIAGTSAWNMFNSYSGMVQHDAKAYGRDDADRVERRVDQNMFGLNQDRTQAALGRAFIFSLSD